MRRLTIALFGCLAIASGQAPVAVPAPSNFIIFQENNGHIADIGDVVFILAVFPEKSDTSSWSVQDPGTMNDNVHSYYTSSTNYYGQTVYSSTSVQTGQCSPSIVLSMANSQTLTLYAQKYASTVQTTYKVTLSDQADLYTSGGYYNNPWVFLLQVTSSMKSIAPFVESISIPTGCNYNSYTFTSSQTYIPSNTYASNLYYPFRIDSTLPIVLSYKTSTPAGTYTSGARIEIIFHFSREVVFSQLPDPSSQAAIAAAAAGYIASGCPFVQLNSNAYAPLQGYALANDSTRLLFVYQVGNGEATPAGVGLDLAQYTGIQLNGGSIKSAYTGIIANFVSMGRAYGSIGEHPSRCAQHNFQKSIYNFSEHVAVVVMTVSK